MERDRHWVLEWDSEFFGVKIGRVDGDTLTDEDVETIDKWAAKEGIDCVYFLADINDRRTILAAEKGGFSFVDVRVILDVKVDSKVALERDDSLREAVTRDIAELREIAAGSYTQTRFHFDERFDSKKADELYRTWIENSCGDYADIVLVIEIDGAVVGFVSGHLDDDKTGRIGLVGVSVQARGMGVGTRLTDAALDWFSERGVERVTVSTQARNLGALRLYEKSGFRVYSTELWYHKWYGGQ